MIWMRTIPTSSRDRKRPDTEATARLDLDSNEPSAAAAGDCEAGSERTRPEVGQRRNGYGDD